MAGTHGVRRTARRVLGGLACACAAGLLAYMVTPAAVRTASGTGRSAAVPAAGATTARADAPGAGLPQLRAGRHAPGFSLPRLGGGRPVRLSAYRGRPVVLNFFASWCPDCRAELGAFARVSDATVGRVAFVGVDTNDSSPAAARRLLSSAGDRYPVGIDSGAAVANGEYLVLALPATVFVAASGRVVGQVFGPQSAQSLDRWVHRLESSTRAKVA